MKKSKIILAITLITVLSAFLTGCDLFGFDPSDYCCASGLLPMPMAAACLIFFVKKS
jgi:hypothetical protein